METCRGRFFGTGRSVAHPLPGRTRRAGRRGPILDDRPIAALLATLEIPAHGERTVVVILGQADDRQEAEAVIARYQDVDRGPCLVSKKPGSWWLGLMDTLQVQTNQPRVRPLPGLAEVPGPGRADLGPARVLPGQRGLRLSRSASGLGQPDLDGPRRGPEARSCCTPRSSSRGRRRPLVPSLAGRADRIRRRGRMLRTTCSGWRGSGRATSARPATTRCWTR